MKENTKAGREQQTKIDGNSISDNGDSNNDDDNGYNNNHNRKNVNSNNDTHNNKITIMIIIATKIAKQKEQTK